MTLIFFGFISDYPPYPRHPRSICTFIVEIIYSRINDRNPINAAELMGAQDQVGSVEAGKFADLITVAGDPLKDISELKRVKFVMKGGDVVKNELPK